MMAWVDRTRAHEHISDEHPNPQWAVTWYVSRKPVLVISLGLIKSPL